MSSQITAELKKPSELSPAEREAWQEFTDHNSTLTSPYFRLEFADAMEVARTDTRVIVARRSGELLGFLPLQLGKVGYARPLGGPLGDVQGLIQPGGAQADPRDWLRASGVPLFEFQSAVGVDQKWRDYGRTQDGSWVCDLSGGFEAYEAHRQLLSPSAFKNIRSRTRRLEKVEEGFEFCLQDERLDVFDTMIEWKRQQYHRTQVFDVFSVGWTKTLLEAILKTQTDRFRGTCSTLRIGGKIAAVHIGMASEALTHYWFPAYDPEFNRISPGLLLLIEMIKDAAERGHTGLELGPGEYRFKLELGSYQVPLWQGCMMTRSAPAVLRGVSQVLAGACEKAPLGKIGSLPRRALRKADKLAAFYAW
ncbi:GNAT family N-acetyltransferase [Hyphobacterium sp.]|uniref:GNAT family N-acetyltransferase n=1 Tax=Hyphobacterium sp. TaxID=2004662 RepID=UPI003BA8D0BD